MNPDVQSKKRLVDILTHKNWREWFKLIELYFIREELDFMLNNIEKEYCIVAGFIDQSRIPTSSKASVTGLEEEDLLRKLGNLSLEDKEKILERRINMEKQRQDHKASAKVLYTISICIDLLDANYIYKIDIVKGK